jgi:acetyl esterase/lipase
MMHMHIGGWAIGSEDGQDVVLKKIADNSSLLVISIGYRLAPEDSFPAGPNDCFDTAEWLVENAKSTFGAELAFIGGESAGGHLSIFDSTASTPLPQVLLLQAERAAPALWLLRPELRTHYLQLQTVADLAHRCDDG